jgi:hypothetical protein
MANLQMVNVQTGTPEKPKYNVTGTTVELWSVAVTTALAINDILLGPTIPAGAYVTGVTVAPDDLDTGTTITFRVGYTGQTAAFIATGNTGMQSGTVATMNVPSGFGYTAATDTQVIITIVAAAGHTPGHPLKRDPAELEVLSKLLDDALALAPAERATWIESLPVTFEGLKPTLRRLLVATGPETGDVVRFGQGRLTRVDPHPDGRRDPGWPAVARDHLLQVPGREERVPRVVVREASTALGVIG